MPNLLNKRKRPLVFRKAEVLLGYNHEGLVDAIIIPAEDEEQSSYFGAMLHPTYWRYLSRINALKTRLNGWQLEKEQLDARGKRA